MDITGRLPVENQTLCFAKGLLYGEEEVQMCTPGSDLQLRDAPFVLENVFFSFFLCICIFSMLATMVITLVLEGISHPQGL